MNRKVVSGITLTLLLISMLTFVFNIHLVKASGNGTVYITPDGLTSAFASVRDGNCGAIHWGSGVANESEFFNFGMGDIFWSIRNEELGYFYGSSFSTPTVFFTDKIEDYLDSYDSYQGVEHIWEFTNASDHKWFTQHCIIFAEETSPYYTGILLIQQGDLYGAIKPKSIHNGDLGHSEEYVLEYDWWYDDSGNSDFSSLKPSVAIYTDKYSYSTGETMNLGLNVTNPAGQINVCFAVWVVRPAGSRYLYLHMHDILLPANFSYSNPAFRTIILPNLPPGIYTWHAAFLNPTTHIIIVEDTAEWQFS